MDMSRRDCISNQLIVESHQKAAAKSTTLRIDNSDTEQGCDGGIHGIASIKEDISGTVNHIPIQISFDSWDTKSSTIRDNHNLSHLLLTPLIIQKRF